MLSPNLMLNNDESAELIYALLCLRINLPFPFTGNSVAASDNEFPECFHKSLYSTLLKCSRALMRLPTDIAKRIPGIKQIWVPSSSIPFQNPSNTKIWGELYSSKVGYPNQKCHLYMNWPIKQDPPPHLPGDVCWAVFNLWILNVNNRTTYALTWKWNHQRIISLIPNKGQHSISTGRQKDTGYWTEAMHNNQHKIIMIDDPICNNLSVLYTF